MKRTRKTNVVIFSSICKQGPSRIPPLTSLTRPAINVWPRPIGYLRISYCTCHPSAKKPLQLSPLNSSTYPMNETQLAACRELRSGRKEPPFLTCSWCMCMACGDANLRILGIAMVNAHGSSHIDS